MPLSRLNRFKRSPIDSWPFEALLNFPLGLHGFESHTRFVLIGEKEEIPYLRLVSEEDRALSFFVVDPFPIFPTYEPVITKPDILDIGVTGEAKLILLAIVNKHERPYTMNLGAPLLIYWQKRRGKQLLFPADSSYPVD